MERLQRVEAAIKDKIRMAVLIVDSNADGTYTLDGQTFSQEQLTDYMTARGVVVYAAGFCPEIDEIACPAIAGYNVQPTSCQGGIHAGGDFFRCSARKKYNRLPLDIAQQT